MESAFKNGNISHKNSNFWLVSKTPEVLTAWSQPSSMACQGTAKQLCGRPPRREKEPSGRPDIPYIL